MELAGADDIDGKPDSGELLAGKRIKYRYNTIPSPY
jgi:hypothetical protein